MAEQCGPGNQAMGNGSESPPDGWICINTRTKDLMARSSNAEEDDDYENKTEAKVLGKPSV